MGWFDEPKRRTLTHRDKEILYHRANCRCENPGCPSKGKKLEYAGMHAGHKNPACMGGSATLRNSVCLCYTCNKLQGTDSWAVFMRKQGSKKVRTVTSGKPRVKRRKKKSSWSLFG